MALSHGCWQRAQVLTTWASPQSHLSILTTWQLDSLRAGNLREQGSGHNVFYDIASKKSLRSYKPTLHHLLYAGNELLSVAYDQRERKQAPSLEGRSTN